MADDAARPWSNLYVPSWDRGRTFVWHRHLRPLCGIQALVAPLKLQVDSSFRRMRLPDKRISARQTLFSRDA